MVEDNNIDISQTIKSEIKANKKRQSIVKVKLTN